ncbi:MAG: ATP-binding protein, partial [Caldisericaceae bacterium]|nr:ATP-binding protein [Caldisericaceae bacterium]
RYIVNREGIRFPTKLNKVVIFYGVRRSGKTFILYDLFKKHEETSVYLDFEDDRMQDFEVGDFEKIKEALFELKPELIDKRLVFLFDEIQNVKGWEKFCRRIAERENVSVFVTGSSSKVMPYEINTALRGRSWEIEVFPFSFREYLAAKEINPDKKNLFYGKNKFVLKNYFSKYLRWGGFPEIVFADSEFEKRKLIKEYFNAMFFKDLVERYKITNIILLETLLDKLFSSFATRISLTSFYKQYKGKFPFSKDLLYQYFSYIKESMLVFEVKKFSESVYKRTRNPGKIYLTDTGLAKSLTSDDLGRRLENCIFLELKRRNYEVFYFHGKKECDFIAVKDKEFTPVQVTYELNESNTERETEGLIEACKTLGQNHGLIITFDEKKKIKTDGISIDIIPAYEWLIKNFRNI